MAPPLLTREQFEAIATADQDLPTAALARRLGMRPSSTSVWRRTIRDGWFSPLHVETCTECRRELLSGPNRRTCHTACEERRQERFNAEFADRWQAGAPRLGPQAKPRPTTEDYDLAVFAIRDGATIAEAAAEIGVVKQALTRELQRRGLSVRGLRTLRQGASAELRTCDECGQAFTPRAPRQKRHPECQVRHKRRYLREYLREYKKRKPQPDYHRPSSLTTAARLLDIYLRQSRGETLTSEQIADDYGVSQRSGQLYLRTLRQYREDPDAVVLRPKRATVRE